jgi:hypothetical protein
MCRADYLRTTLQSLAGLRGLGNVTVIVSQDGNDSAVAQLVQDLAEQQLRRPAVRAFEHWQHPRVALLGASQVRGAAAHLCVWAMHGVFCPKWHPCLYACGLTHRLHACLPEPASC